MTFYQTVLLIISLLILLYLFTPKLQEVSTIAGPQLSCKCLGIPYTTAAYADFNEKYCIGIVYACNQ